MHRLDQNWTPMHCSQRQRSLFPLPSLTMSTPPLPARNQPPFSGPSTASSSSSFLGFIWTATWNRNLSRRLFRSPGEWQGRTLESDSKGGFLEAWCVWEWWVCSLSWWPPRAPRKDDMLNWALQEPHPWPIVSGDTDLTAVQWCCTSSMPTSRTCPGRCSLSRASYACRTIWSEYHKPPHQMQHSIGCLASTTSEKSVHKTPRLLFLGHWNSKMQDWTTRMRIPTQNTQRSCRELVEQVRHMFVASCSSSLHSFSLLLDLASLQLEQDYFRLFATHAGIYSTHRLGGRSIPHSCHPYRPQRGRGCIWYHSATDACILLARAWVFPFHNVVLHAFGYELLRERVPFLPVQLLEAHVRRRAACPVVRRRYPFTCCCRFTLMQLIT